MYFWLKFFHIAAMAVWFTGLFFLPRLFVARVQKTEEADPGHLDTVGKTLYFGVMTPAGAITIVLGTLLISYGFEGAWFPAKLFLVAFAVMLHLYCGLLLFELGRGHARHGVFFHKVLNWSPLLLLLGITALAAAKPWALPPLGGT